MEKKNLTSDWFRELRDGICTEFEKIEGTSFTRKKWNRDGGGGGEMSIMRGKIFEKVGVNISTVYGVFSPEFRNQIPGAQDDGKFYATGISLVAHMMNPFVPAVHMNTRFIVTSNKEWFGGGADLNPIYPIEEDTKFFHDELKKCCDDHDPAFYKKYKDWADEYFYIKHRGEPRGVGGIFYDYLEGDFDKNFSFTKDVGKTFLRIYPEIVRKNMKKLYGEDEREYQSIRRGRYAEFNLAIDRGTKFGFATGGNSEAILMSLPPNAKWP